MPVTAAPEEVGLSGARLGRVRDWMQRWVDSGALPGMLVLVARRGEIAFLEAYGPMDVETGAPVEEDTIFRIYSMTKPVTSVATMMLYEEGRFQLDDPVARYVPSFAAARVYVSGEGDSIATEPARRPVTVHDLLTHTAGLTYGEGNEGPVPALYRDHRTDFGPDDGPLEEVVVRLARLPLSFHPGDRWEYGVSTDVLGHLVEVLSGTALDRFMEQRILRPLGMVDTGFVVPAEKAGRLAVLYERAREHGLSVLELPTESPYVKGVTTLSGGAGLVSTIGDFFRFTEMLRRRGELDGVRLLGPKTVAYMTTNQLPGDLSAMGQPTFNETTYEGIGFGLGFSVVLDPVRAKVLTSPGEYAWGGYASTAFWVDPVEDLTVILMTQMIPSSAYPLRRELRALTYQALTD